jgi:hypothetical protein
VTKSGHVRAYLNGKPCREKGPEKARRTAAIGYSAERPVARRHAIERILFSVLHPLDIHVFTPEEFEETAYEALTFAWVIVRQARIYHATEEGKRRIRSLFA